MRIWFPVVALLLAAACSTDNTGSSGSGRKAITTTVPGWSFVNTVNLGGVGAPEESIVFGAAMLAEDSTGMFIVLNAGDGRVAAYRADGSFIGVVGHRGDGPGGYSSPTGIAVRSGRIYLLDSAAGRISMFDREDLQFIRSISTGMQHGVPMSIVPVDDRAMYVEFAPFPGLPSVGDGDRGGDIIIVHIDLESGEQHVAMQFSNPAGIRVEQTEGYRKTFRVVDPPFSPRLRWTVDEAGCLLFGDGSEPVVVVLVDGARQVVIDDPAITAARVTASDRAAYQERHPELAGVALEFPEQHPYYTDIRVGPGGTRWLQVAQGETGQQWLVYSFAGERLGRVDVQPGTRIVALGNATVDVVTYDELDVETLQRFELLQRSR